MKVKVEFDMTPEEFRRALGLPDVQEYNRKVLEAMLTKMTSGEEGYDPMSLFQPMMRESMGAMEEMQKAMLGMVSGFSSASSTSSDS